MKTQSEIVQITKARLPARAALQYRADAYISTDKTPILAHFSAEGVSS